MTRRLETKAAVIRAMPEMYLKQFWEWPLSARAMHQAQKCLVKVVDLKSTSETFD